MNISGVGLSGTAIFDDGTLPPPVYNITPDTTTINEGSTVTYTVTTENVPNGTYYWTNSGTTVAADFTDNANSGSFTITDGTGTITRTLVNEFTVESDETIILQLRTDSVSGSVVATAATVTVRSPTYAVSPSTTAITEGESVTYTVTFTYAPDGTYYWTNSGTTVAADFTDDANSGSFTVTGGSGTIVRSVKNDTIIEGTETLILQLRTGSVSGTILATASTVNVTNRAPIYSITPNITSMTENETVTYTVSVQYAPDGTYYWTNSGTTTGADFTDGLNSGSFTVTSGAGTITRTTIQDVTTEGSETLILQMRTGSTGGTVVATAATVTVTDTSTSPTGQAEYTTPGTYSWVAPAGVTSVCVVAVGGGGGGQSQNGSGGWGGGGGGLGWRNNISVTPGNSYTVVVGSGGAPANSSSANSGGASYFIIQATVEGGGGGGGVRNTGASGGTYQGDGGGNGGSVASHTSTVDATGGGGAGGYSGNGGDGGPINTAGSAGSGGGGGGGGAGGSSDAAGAGGGVGIYGQGDNGAAGTYNGNDGGPGGGGSGGQSGSASPGSTARPSTGGAYGGGGGGAELINENGPGAGGAVRIIWGPGRAFPATNTQNI